MTCQLCNSFVCDYCGREFASHVVTTIVQKAHELDSPELETYYVACSEQIIAIVQEQVRQELIDANPVSKRRWWQFWKTAKPIKPIDELFPEHEMENELQLKLREQIATVEDTSIKGKEVQYDKVNGHHLSV